MFWVRMFSNKTSRYANKKSHLPAFHLFCVSPVLYQFRDLGSYRDPLQYQCVGPEAKKEYIYIRNYMEIPIGNKKHDIDQTVESFAII